MEGKQNHQAPEVADDAPATSAETREDFLDRASGGYTKVRHSFIQTPGVPPKGSAPGKLAEFGRNHRAAVLYLALLANWPWLRREEDPLPAETWIRFLRCDDPGALTWTPQSLSHAWGVLSDLKLVERPRKNRLINVRPRREDGEDDYIAPQGRRGTTGQPDSYLVLPNAFWTSQLHGTLTWPALAVLLILLKETGAISSAELLVDRAKPWYGISRTTAEEGLAELRSREILHSQDRYIKDTKAAKGRRHTSLHTLLPPFSTEERRNLRDAARSRVNGTAAHIKFRREREGDDAEEEAKF